MVPHEFSRNFPEIKPIHTKYKAPELKIFLFYLSVPVLLDLLPKDMWSLLFIYVFAIRTFFEPNITLVDLNQAGLQYLFINYL